MTKRQGNIYAGIGGWTFEPWRGAFYPKGLAHAKRTRLCELQQLTTIEINGTFYRTQTPGNLCQMAPEVPDGFVFAIKGPRYVVQPKRGWPRPAIRLNVFSIPASVNWATG